jgi:hypothetical protein
MYCILFLNKIKKTAAFCYNCFFYFFINYLI